MPLRTTTRMSDPPADLGYQKPILDFGNALNLNVSDGVSAIGMSRRGYSPSSGRLKVGTKPKSSWPRPSRESDLPRVAGAGSFVSGVPHAEVNRGGFVLEQRPDDLDGTLAGGEHRATGQIERWVLDVIAGHGFQAMLG